MSGFVGEEDSITEAGAPATEVAILPILSSLEEAKSLAAGAAAVSTDDDFFKKVKAGVEQLESDVRDELQSVLTNRNRSTEHDVADELEDESLDEASPAVSGLKLAVDSLDTQLRHCLLYLAAFPKLQVIKKRLLIHWWIGEGAVRCVEAGMRCFDELVSRGLLQPVLRRHCDRVHACTVHPLVHKYVKAVANSEHFVEPFSGGDSRNNARMFVRKADTGGGGGGGGDKLVTVYNISEQYVELDTKWLAKQMALRAMQLGQWRSSAKCHVEAVSAEFLEVAARRCRNLKYLSLRGMSLVGAIPDAIGKLRNLVVLDVHACHNLETLPASLGALHSLEYLDVSGCHVLELVPRSVGHLARLEVLKGFVIAGTRTKGDPCRLADLSRLQKLRKLSIRVGHHKLLVPEDDIDRQLHGCHALRVLTITWGSVVPAVVTVATEAISFPSGIEKLDLRCMPNRSPPPWFHPATLTRLKKLYVRGGAVESLGSGEGWSVETLRLRFLKNLKFEWTTLRRAFPRLDHVEHWECAHLGAWRRVTDKRGIWTRADDDAIHADIPCPLAFYRFFGCGAHC